MDADSSFSGLFICGINMDIKSIEKPVTMSSREISALTGKEHKHVIRDIRVMLLDLNLYIDGYAQSWTNPQNGQTYQEYLLDKELVLTLLTGYSTPLRNSVIKRWKELENNSNLSVKLPDFNNPVEAARAWADAKESEQKANQELLLAAPKISHYDTVVERSTLVTATQVAQKIGMSAVALNQALDTFDVYSKAVKRGRVFKQWFIDAGHGELKQTDAGYTQPLFTMKGEAWVIEKMISEGYSLT